VKPTPVDFSGGRPAHLLLLLLLFGLGHPAAGQTKGEDPVVHSRASEANDGTDPTRPLPRVDFRNDFFADWQEFENDRSFNVTSLGGAYQFGHTFSVRLDVPVVTTNLTFTTKTGLGDIPIRADYTIDKGGSARYQVGMETVMPTASELEMGTGKLLLGPLAGVVFDLDNGFWGVFLKDLFSVGGDASRTDVHELAIRPFFKLDLGKRWYAMFNPDIRVNWISKRVFFPFTAEFGKLFGREWVLALRTGGHISNADKRYDWRLQIRLSYLFQ
jgi:hypothetical protein